MRFAKFLCPILFLLYVIPKIVASSFAHASTSLMSLIFHSLVIRASVLSLFTSAPDALQYFSIVSRDCWMEWASVSRSVVSFAYATILFSVFGVILYPFMFLFCLIDSARPSAE